MCREFGFVVHDCILMLLQQHSLACRCCCSNAVSDLVSTVVPDLVSAVVMSYPVCFAMGFTDRLSMYRLHGSAAFPDAETLVIPLMGLQIIGVPMRSHAGQGRLFFPWQNMNGLTLNFSMQELRFEFMSHEFIMLALL